MLLSGPQPSPWEYDNSVLSHDLVTMLASIYDELLVMNIQGEILWTSERVLEEFWGIRNGEMTGQNIYELEKKMHIKPSVFQYTLEKKQKVSMIHETWMGTRALATAIPVCNPEGVMERILMASCDLTSRQSFKREQLPPLDRDNLQKTSFVAHSDKMKGVLHQIDKVAKVSATVLLIGESGVGKEIVATAIHRLGERENRPIVKVNCGAIPEKLLESELFGYKRGAFTGADPKGKIGYFAQANQGIIFLDEISELPLGLQVKLLRVLQEREFTPLGGIEPIKLDVQVIAATNRNLEELVEAGTFREDLYYRLNVVPIHIPPLRERVEDIAPLVHHFAEKYKQRYKKEIGFTPDAIDMLKIHPWPGNVRELENFIERVVVTSECHTVDANMIQRLMPPKKATGKTIPTITTLVPLQQALDHIEEQLILMAMDQYKSIKLAAQALEISQPTMSRKYHKIQENLAKRKLPERNEAMILEEELDKQLRSIATVTATSLNAEEVEDLLAHLSEENPVYSRLRNRLTTIRELEGEIEWSYIFTVTPDQRVITLVADRRLNLKVGDEYKGPPEIMNAYFDAMKGKVKVTPRYTDAFGEWKTSVAPIRNESGKVIAVLGSDFSIEYVTKQVRKLSTLLKFS